MILLQTKFNNAVGFEILEKYIEWLGWKRYYIKLEKCIIIRFLRHTLYIELRVNFIDKIPEKSQYMHNLQ